MGFDEGKKLTRKDKNTSKARQGGLSNKASLRRNATAIKKITDAPTTKGEKEKTSRKTKDYRSRMQSTV